MRQWHVAAGVREVAAALQRKPVGKHAHTWQNETRAGTVYFMLFEEYFSLPGGWCIAAVKLDGGDDMTEVEVVGRAGGGGLFRTDFGTTAKMVDRFGKRLEQLFPGRVSSR